MNKENILTFRLPGDLYRDLSQRAAKEGCTISDLARKIIMEHAKVEEMSRVLEDITKKHSAEHGQLQEMVRRLSQNITTSKISESQNSDIEKILRLVSWIAEASPYASKKWRESGFK